MKSEDAMREDGLHPMPVRPQPVAPGSPPATAPPSSVPPEGGGTEDGGTGPSATRSVGAATWSGRGGAARQAFDFEPTVVGSVRRHPVLVLVVTVLTALAGVGYTLVQPERFRANGGITVPAPASSAGLGSDQYLDSQVLLLQSHEVAQRAVRIANGALGENRFTLREFTGGQKALEISPPEGANPGSFGASIVTLSFTATDARTAQVGVNAVLQAFDDARVASIRAQGDATVAGIERSLQTTKSQDVRGELLTRRAKAMGDQQIDLAQRPTFRSASLPDVPVNGNSKRAGLIGLLVGGVLGAALAFARDLRRLSFSDAHQPGLLYGAPLLGEAERDRRAAVVADDAGAHGEALRLTACSVDRIHSVHGSPIVLACVAARPGDQAGWLVANLALALGRGGTRVLAVEGSGGCRGGDRDPGTGITAPGELSRLLLPATSVSGGLEQVLSGEEAVGDCVVTSPLNTAVDVLAAGWSGGVAATASGVPGMVTGRARASAVKGLMEHVRARYDVILIEPPSVLAVADAAALVGAADAVIVVVGADDLVADHRRTVDRLDLVGVTVAGYVFVRPGRGRQRRAWLKRRAAASPVPSDTIIRAPADSSRTGLAAGAPGE